MEAELSGIRIFAPAKVNTYLSVGDTRADGFHDIDSVMVCISLCDEITVGFSDADSFCCSERDLESSDNLVVKALRLVREMVDVPPIETTLTKRIPIQAGLGGGSSDCAAFLHAANLLLGEPLSLGDLTSVALACSSDAGFFASRQTSARVQGRGEVVTAVSPPEWSHIVVAKPAAGECTSSAYSRLDKLDRAARTRPEAEAGNDFELVVGGDSRLLMSRLGAGSKLCGSGSAVFCTFETALDAERMSKQLMREGYWAVAAQRLERFPEPEWM